MKNTALFSLWKIEHESAFSVTAKKLKDTSNRREVEKFLQNHSAKGAVTLYRNENEVDAQYLQTLEL